MDTQTSEKIISGFLENPRNREAFEDLLSRLKDNHISKLSLGKPPSGDTMMEGVEMTRFKACMYGLNEVGTALKRLYPKEE